MIRTNRPAAAIALLVLCSPATGWAQIAGPTPIEGNSPSVGRPTGVAPQVESAVEDWAVHGQTTFVTQYHPRFRSAFRGPNSLSPKNQARETFDLTLYGGLRPWQGAEIWVNPEIDQGFGLSNTFGVAGYPSGEAFKLGKSNPYARLQRVFLRQTIDLGGQTERLAGGLNQLAGSQSADRLVVTIGKFAITDVFDTNSYAHDPRNDFLNWSIIDAGSFDYAGDAWGYSYGAVVEWYRDWWTIRSGLFNLPKVPGGTGLDTRFLDQYQFDQEFEARHELFGRPGKLKLLAFLSHGRMGRYDEATALAAATGTPADSAAVRKPHDRAGFVLNLEQRVTDDLGVFARTGVSQGQYETFAFTDIHKTVSLGLSLAGARWGRPQDTAGLAFAVNDASNAAKRFFAAGGLGILIGDGMLVRSGPEKIVEAYYSFAAFRSARLSLDYQFVANPAYNRDRGPVSILGLRVHAEL